MKKEKACLGEIRLFGISARTNNLNEMNPDHAKIGQTRETYFSMIKPRKRFGVIFCVYTNYESDFTGDYTYFIGEEETDDVSIEGSLETLIIPAQNYIKLTTDLGPMPKVIIDLWQDIWTMKTSDLGGQRSYNADFEVYDETSQDLENTSADIYIGVE